jgi:putative aldouronate transport system substrate-binding protein
MNLLFKVLQKENDMKTNHSKNKIRNFLLLLVAGILMISCSKPVSEQPASATTFVESFDALNLNQVPDRYDPPITMNSVISVDATVKFLGDDDIYNNVWTRAYSQLLGINMNYQWVSDVSLYDEKLGLSVNSGEIPDMFRVTPAQMQLYYEAGLLADLSDIYESEASEKTRSVLAQNPVALKAATIDGHLMGIPLTDAPVANASLLWVRQDWMDQLDIEPPTTMSDVIEISRRFTLEDPNGNGIDDTIGLCITQGLWGQVSSLQGFFNGYHAYPNIWYEKDGALVYGSVQPEMRDALLALQEMYANGQIDQEFGVKDINQVAETIAQSRCGMQFGVWWNPYHPLNLSQQNDPQAFWTAFPIPSVDDQIARSQYSSNVGALLVVRNGYEHPEALIRMVNFWTENILNSDDDEIRRVFLGDIEAPDVTLYKYTNVVLWEPDATIIGGRKLREALASKDPSGLDLETQWRYRIIQAYFEQGILEAWVEVATNGPTGAVSILEEILEDRGIMNQFYGTPTPTMAEKMSTLQTMQDVMITKVIMGDSIELFDQFVEDWYQLGGTEIVDEVNDWAENIK